MAEVLTESELGLLRQSFRIAEQARRKGNHPFGALLVSSSGRVLTAAENSVVTGRDLTAHAELNLVRGMPLGLAPGELGAATIYSSTEPCPMCAGAIHWSRIGRVVYGLSARRLYELTRGGDRGSLIDLPCREVLRRSSNPVTVIGPALEEEAERVHQGFWETLPDR